MQVSSNFADRSRNFEVTRRNLLKCSAIAPFLVSTPVLSQQRYPAADMHAHFFNVADLPISGFIAHVFWHGNLGRTRIGRAALDAMTYFAKRFASSAEEEIRAISGGRTLPDVSPKAFGDYAADLIDTRVRQLGDGSEAEQELALGYQEYVAAVAADAGYANPLIESAVATPYLKSADGPDAVPSTYRKQLIAYSFASVAEKAENEDIIDPGLVVEKRAQGVGGLPDFMARLEIPFLSKASHMAAWAFMMCRTRRTHIEEFVDKYGGAKAYPAMAVNHLVDYDYWLDDKPAKGSSPLQQVRVFSILADRYKNRIELKTFAGFCPLRHAIESLENSPTLFDRYKPLVGSGEIAGFKLYPPMGFRPSGNRELADSEFDPSRRAPRTARDRWKSAGGKDGGLGEALDASLDAFYRWCAAEGVPIMAHAGDGNEAGPGFGQRANPKWWEAVARAYPIKLALGHLIDDADPFVEAVKRGEPFDEAVWSLHGSLRMMRKDSGGYRAEVYGDLGYMPELIDSWRGARDFFVALRNTFGTSDPNLTRIMYGSDWIMLGQEMKFERKLEHIVAGMDAAGYSPEQKENILFRNAQRFLRG